MRLTKIRPASDISKVPLDREKIRKLREALGLSFAKAARQAGMRYAQNWYEIESGRNVNLTIDTLERIASALGVRARDLLR